MACIAIPQINTISTSLLVYICSSLSLSLSLYDKPCESFLFSIFGNKYKLTSDWWCFGNPDTKFPLAIDTSPLIQAKEITSYNILKYLKKSPISKQPHKIWHTKDDKLCLLIMQMNKVHKLNENP